MRGSQKAWERLTVLLAAADRSEGSRKELKMEEEQEEKKGKSDPSAAIR